MADSIGTTPNRRRHILRLCLLSGMATAAGLVATLSVNGNAASALADPVVDAGTVQASSTPNPVTVGTPFTITFSATNTSSATQDLMVVSQEPNALDVTGGNGSGCGEGLGSITCSFPAVAAGASVSGSWTTTPETAGTESLAVNLIGGNSDSIASTSVDIDAVASPVAPSGTLQATVAPSPVTIGSPFTFTYRATNTSSAPQFMQIFANLPTALDLSGGTGTNCEAVFAPASPVVSGIVCNGAPTPVAPGASVTGSWTTTAGTVGAQTVSVRLIGENSDVADASVTVTVVAAGAAISAPLAFTGINVFPLLLAGSGLIAGGCVVLMTLSRHRRRSMSRP